MINISLSHAQAEWLEQHLGKVLTDRQRAPKAEPGRRWTDSDDGHNAHIIKQKVSAARSERSR